jgi:dTDP-4-dehydrorhamnose 3,5-epimerase-like enzyme
MIKSVRWLFVHCVILHNFQILSDSCYTMKMGPTFFNRREANRRMWLIEVFIVQTVHSLS